jgi:hypothetical protein
MAFPRGPLGRVHAGALEIRMGVDEIVEEESRINDALPKDDDAACCTYDVSLFRASVIVDALLVQPAVIIGGILQANPFYMVHPASSLPSAIRQEGTTAGPAVPPASVEL